MLSSRSIEWDDSHLFVLGFANDMVEVRDGQVYFAPEQRLSASWTLNEIFHSEATRLGEYVHQQDPNWDWGKPFDTSILDGYRQGVDMQA